MTQARDIVIGASMLGAGIGLLVMAGQVPRRGAIDAAFVPHVLAWLMVGLGALELVLSLRRGRQGAEAPVETASYLTVAVSLGLIAAFVALLRPLGFPIAAAAFLFAQFWLLTPAGTKPRPVFYAILAMVASGAIFVIFRYLFNLLLPAGPLTPFLP